MALGSRLSALGQERRASAREYVDLWHRARRRDGRLEPDRGREPRAESREPVERIAESREPRAENGLGLPLTLFKAAQIIASRRFSQTFRDFTAIDLETTGKDIASCEVVEVGAVRVRDGDVVADVSLIERERKEEES